MTEATTNRAKVAISDLKDNDWSAKDGNMQRRREQVDFWIRLCNTVDEKDEIVVWVAEEWGSEFLPKSNYKFREGDVVTYNTDSIHDKDEYGTVNADQTDGSDVRVRWYEGHDYAAFEDAAELKLVYPAPQISVRSEPEKLPIVPEYLAEKVGHEGEGDKAPENPQEKPDMVAHPPHYRHPSGIEVIDIVKFETYNRGNIIKYVMRAPYKGNELQDLQKARQYLDWEIERVQNG